MLIEETMATSIMTCTMIHGRKMLYTYCLAGVYRGEMPYILSKKFDNLS